ncbi:MAG: Cell division protein ZapA [Thermoanaerobaculia bacterium]|nr:Cell division protein ZapA [Thermoanaerobaculia bacterium]
MEQQVVSQQVEIFGQVFSIRSSSDPEAVREVAAYVDKRMREVAEETPAVDLAKIAILAALNISDELRQYRTKAQEGDPGRFADRAGRLVERLDEILKSSPSGGPSFRTREKSGTLRGA